MAAKLAPIAVLASTLALFACGGGDDREEVEQVVRDFVQATNERDGERLCGDLLTQEYLEKYTGATGDGAAEACEEQLDVISGLRLRLIAVERVAVDGEAATVRATIATGGQRSIRRFELAKEDGDWKLNAGS